MEIKKENKISDREPSVDSVFGSPRCREEDNNKTVLKTVRREETKWIKLAKHMSSGGFVYTW